MQTMLDLIRDQWGIENDFDVCVTPKGNERYSFFTECLKTMINAKEFMRLDHHLSHAACGFYQSPYEEAIIISFDGAGNDGRFNIYHGKDGRIEKIQKLSIESMGKNYRKVSLSLKDIKKVGKNGSLIRMVAFSGKLMGLSAYGKVRNEWIKGFRKLYETGDIEYVSFVTGRQFISPKTFRKYGKINRNEQFYKEYDGQFAYDVARTNQYAFEEYFIDLTKPFIEEYSHLPIVLTGGCALNVLLNEKLRGIYGNKIYVPPNPDDSGIALGQTFLINPPKEKVRNISYSGLPILDINELSKYVKKYGAQKTNYSELASLLKEGKIIGILQNSSEIGPRALGNRSIICDPCFKNMKDKLNKIKQREWFRPFAPVVRYEDRDKYFHFDFDSPYMSFAPIVREEWREQLQAITHVDNTARVQTVKREDHEFFYELLTEFKGALLNTSFNTKGEPLITTIKDAIDVLENTELDYVYIEGYLFSKAR